ncbi:two pore domain potassium channel family protein [Lysobacter sp. TY2-98]|uniref:potassium channel family protein n=1 Tax=Lysobacter sp. TY2-98 TaxID=2290922 RepID=UPI000E1FD8D6|nr:potassium channel family protein [Lysobacter sp. TY2-98]AXK71789.1 two pore domain potassium channel family protein [Lysobacter sp. TY2-98]
MWRLPSLRGLLHQRRYALLFGLLLASIAIGPLTAEFGIGGGLLDVFLGLTLLATVLPVSSDNARRTTLAVVAIALVLRYAPLRSVSAEAHALSYLLWSVIALLAAYRALRYALSSVPVDADHMLAALSAYLLVGVFCGAVYVAVEAAVPRSLLTAGQPFAHGMSLNDGIYFSFVTLATLGYGDITPVTPIARGLAIFEAIVGQFYLAVLVARLVGLRASAETGDGTRPG